MNAEALESARIERLHRCEILDTPPSPEFDDLALLASQICETPIALLTLVDRDRQWLKARIGMDVTETPRDVAFCAHTILGSEPLVVSDTRRDARFADNPFVTDEPGIRFYAGAPLITDDGFALGTLCVLDRRPRDLSTTQLEALRTLSRQALHLIELHRAERSLDRSRQASRLQQRMIDSSHDCIKLLDLDGHLLSMNAGGAVALEIDDREALYNASWIDFWSGEYQDAARLAVEQARRGEMGRFVGYCPTMKGDPRWWDVVVSPIFDDRDRPERLLATSRDVTDRVRDEEVLQALAAGTAATTGNDFFRSLVRHMAIALDARYAFLAECMSDDGSRVRTRAFWNGDDFGDDFEFDVTSTPCQRVIHGEVAHHPDNLQAMFPDDEILVDWSAESYLGLPLIDATGRVRGHLAVVDDEPMPDTPSALSVLRVFAVRAATELDRLASEERRRALLDINNAIVLNLSGATLFGAVADALRRIISFDRAAIFLHDAESDVLQLRFFETSIPSAAFRVGMELPIHESHVGQTFTEGTVLLRHDLSTEATFRAENALLAEGFRSLVVAPLIARGRTIGTINIASVAADHYSVADAEFLVEVAAQIALAIENMRAYEEVAALKEKLEAENVYLQEEIRTRHGFDEIVGQSPPLQKLLAQVERVAPTDATVLILGETGTGKELVARAIHRLSPRKERPLVVVNCGAISPGLVESELFGHEKGAFTGATTRKIGRFELADGGTLFLDEIGDLPQDLQIKLLRALQEGEIERVGGNETVRVNVRVIAATHRDLSTAVSEGRFRADLFYRLNVFPIYVPALRERPQDIPLLVRYFVVEDGARLGRRIERIPRATMDALVGHAWPGNVRELRNVIERSIITSPDDTLELGDWRVGAMDGGELTATTLAEVERQHILRMLEATGWVVSGPRGAALRLGLKPTTLESRMKRLGIERPAPDDSHSVVTGPTIS